VEHGAFAEATSISGFKIDRHAGPKKEVMREREQQKPASKPCRLHVMSV